MSEDERTARERIVASALRLFAERGVDAVSLRDVASDADVSVALIPHHFGTREGLRDAVDAHVIAIFDALEQQPPTELTGDGAVAGFVEALLSALPQGSPIPAYVRRLLLSGTEGGRLLFRRWYELSVRLLANLEVHDIARPAVDPQMRAAFLLVNDLAMILLHEHVHDATGVDPLSPDGSARWAAEAIDAYTHGVFRKETL
ncbi:TetR/AcrR family transcriptional regulator [Microbacterium sp. C7(2022)]|uniref:TetR/AcrR family transcriptional regulator n=1 Tax=Microbacterium sp. C7(2022) TaxID=2992759 RepID=UPI00237AB969|nr:TetR/AcrR family transcriptional regulator [Microbacterium sp. C7(2022)]MDE0546050.1 TetR/AcrR family transcriptional regulator [Microbacterium sp. C7(2022)]